MEVNVEDIKKWTKALRSGKYKQRKGLLQDSYGYCCLGVACDIFIKDKEKIVEKGLMVGDVPTEQDMSPEWLKNLDDDFFEKTKYFLVQLNDELCFNFNEIADLLEAVYIHKVLDQEIK